MDKNEILEAIGRLAASNGGKAPGRNLFRSETGISESDWYPHLWARWGDALREAGYEPNTLNQKFADEHLFQKYAELAAELKRVPIEADLLLRRKKDRSFPNTNTFRRLGDRVERAKKLLDHFTTNGGHSEIAAACRAIINSPAATPKDDSEKKGLVGYVYLIKHGNRAEYKIGRTNNPLRRDGEISLELPDKLRPIHRIATDDPAGIERYWHERFKDKRKNGEWFALGAADVRAFSKWKKIC